MGQPIEGLSQARNSQNHDQVSKQPRTKAESVLLHARVDPGGEGDIGDLNQHDGQGAMRAGVSHCREVDERAGSGAHESTLPVPVGEGLLQKRRMQWGHAFHDGGSIKNGTSICGYTEVEIGCIRC